MLLREKIDETFINNAAPQWSKALFNISPMIAALIILLTAILLSVVWYDQPVQRYEEPRSPGKQHAPEA
jgi:hypothetical protein